MHTQLGDQISAIHANQPLAAQLEKALIGAYPKYTVPILKDGADDIIGEPVESCEVAKMPIAVAHQPSAFDADPQRSVARHGQAKDAVSTECRGIFTLVIAEVAAIEAH